MTLPTKDSRPIEVNSKKYRWMARAAVSQPASNRPLVVTVQEDTEAPGAILRAEMQALEWVGMGDDAHPANDVPFTPEDVRAVIQEGLIQGWEPSVRGKPFVLKGLKLSRWEC